MEITKLDKLISDGTMSELYRAGLANSKAFEYREIYYYIDAQIRTRGISQNKAIEEAELKFNRGRTYIFEAINLFKK